MFIIIETIGFNHPLKSTEGITFLDQYSYAHFEIAEVTDPSIDLSSVIHTEVPEEVARACKFAKADHNDRLGIVEGSGIHEELMNESLEHHAKKPKVYYTLNEQDIENQVKFMKAVMALELEMHYRGLTDEERNNNVSYKQSIVAEIEACSTMLECRELLHKKFGLATGHVLPTELGWGDSLTLLSQ